MHCSTSCFFKLRACSCKILLVFSEEALVIKCLGEIWTSLDVNVDSYCSRTGVAPASFSSALPNALLVLMRAFTHSHPSFCPPFP